MMRWWATNGDGLARLPVWCALGLACAFSLAVPSAHGAVPCGRLEVGQRAARLDLYLHSDDLAVAAAVRSADVTRLCGLDENVAKDLRYHVHIEWAPHDADGEYWIPTFEISADIRPDTPIQRPRTYPAGTLSQLEPYAARGVQVIYFASHGSAPPSVEPASELVVTAPVPPGGWVRGSERLRLLRIMTTPMPPSSWMRGAERPLVHQIDFGAESRSAPEQINAAIDTHAWASPSAEPSAETIKRLQSALNKAGARLVVDGKMGLQTGMALADWQRARGLRATGRLDPASERLLGLAAEGKREYETAVGPPRP
jgi:hypothetical protein